MDKRFKQPQLNDVNYPMLPMHELFLQRELNHSKNYTNLAQLRTKYFTVYQK